MNNNFYEKLLTIWERLNSELDIDFVLTNAMSLLEEEIGAERSSIWEIDSDKNEIFFRILSGDESEKLKEIRLKMGEGVVGHTISEKKVIIINNVKQSPYWSKKVDSVSHFETKSILSVPLEYKGEVIGAIQLINKIKGDGFSKEDSEKVKMIAIPISTALVNAKMYNELKNIFFETSLALADAIEKRDYYTAGHTRRVMKYSVMIGERLGFSKEQLYWLSLSAILHDIGKIGIPDAILNKQAPLDSAEREIMKKHPVLGYEIVKKVEGLRKALDGILYHHETEDGSGYPEGLKNGEIPLFAKIISVCDTFDAMTTDRPYRKALSYQKAIEEIDKYSGKQFDPRVVEVFKTIINEKVMRELNEG
ncbi:metal dependent phosphohydrolase [Thermotomaculum hydrothermale]|uniref:Metal dependent phosphohydrolase n=1 Tax=Thermotomaculum hydrothermale TaxID=981385 RepID=A0A7R6Q054_9BACT|nr:HD domain-containing phosphohydrolase [Thermotomaculum hydrothermale]BBB33028.1 metal dependent phosphohydrolase [Thermotomaculum hydrothermale]